MKYNLIALTFTNTVEKLSQKKFGNSFKKNELNLLSL